MKRPRIKLRTLLIVVAALALLLALGRFIAPRLLGRRPGGYRGTYWYFDENWNYHEIRGNIIYDDGRFVFSD